MKCVICKNGETQPGKTTVTLEREDLRAAVERVSQFSDERSHAVKVQICPGEVKVHSGNGGSSGKLSRDIPAIRVRERPQTRLAHWFSMNLTCRSTSGRRRT